MQRFTQILCGILALVASVPGYSQASSGREWIAIHRVNLHVTDSVRLPIRTLHGEVLRTHADQPAALDDAHSFRIRVTAASVALTGHDLAEVLNTYVFAYPGAPLSDLRANMEGQAIVLTGVIHKVVPLRFRIRGVPTLMPDGRVRIHPTAVRILGVNGEKVLHTVGLHLDNVLNLDRAHGMTVKGDDMFLDPTAIVPPPAIEGRLASIKIEDSTLVEDFVALADDSVVRADVRAAAAQGEDSTVGYIYFRGGQLRFGHLLMTDTDLRIVNMDTTSRGPFDMNLPQYNQQLTAGYSRTHPNLGLTAYMKNFTAR